jgi:hypothetical protein
MDKLYQNALKPNTAVESTPPTPAKKAEIQFPDFEKLELRSGIILEAEKVAKADKLLKLLVDLGFEKRTIVSGIALHFKPEDIIGKPLLEALPEIKGQGFDDLLKEVIRTAKPFIAKKVEPYFTFLESYCGSERSASFEPIKARTPISRCRVSSLNFIFKEHSF